MSERGLSEEAMLSGLRDIRLPVEAAGGTLAEFTAVVALAAAAALVLGVLVRPFSQKQALVREPSLLERIDALAEESEDGRRVALLHILKAHAPDRFAALHGALYRPGASLDLANLEAEVRRLA